MKVFISKLCPTLWDPMECSPPGSSVHGILQPQYWSCQFPSPGEFPNPGIELRSPAMQADSLSSEWYLLEHCNTSPWLSAGHEHPGGLKAALLMLLSTEGKTNDQFSPISLI